jgi:hypothetical protein
MDSHCGTEADSKAEAGTVTEPPSSTVASNRNG